MKVLNEQKSTLTCISLNSVLTANGVGIVGRTPNPSFERPSCSLCSREMTLVRTPYYWYAKTDEHPEGIRFCEECGRQHGLLH